MDIGFIGLGHMGSGMARCLLKAGHRLKVYNRSRDKAEKLAAEGAVVVDRPGDACRGDAVITMLADDGAVEGVTFGEGNILASLGQNTVHVSMSTISVALSDRLSQAHGRAGRAYIAAPVFGRPDAAAAGKLSSWRPGLQRRLRVASRCSTRWGRRRLSSARSPRRQISSY